MAQVGRPSSYSEQTADFICEALARGDSLRKICESEGVPTLATILHWLVQRPEFYSKYARARLSQAEVMDMKIMETAERCLAGELDAYAAKVAIGAFQWRAAKLAPKVYGDATMLKHADADGNSLKVEVTRISDAPRALTPPKLLEAPKDETDGS